MWRQAGPVDDRDDVGGDAQAGRAYGMRCTNPRLPNALVEVHFYVAYSLSEAAKARPSGPPYFVRRSLTYTIAGDVTRPGDTEQWCDSGDREVDGPYGALDLAEDAARALARAFRPSCLTWDGRPFGRLPEPV
jgi:hypothetical protein